MKKTKNNTSKKMYLTFIGFGLASIIIVLVVSYLLRLGKERALPPFEEIYTPSKQLLSCICLIDKSISDGFYKIGVPQEKILFLSVHPTHKDNYKWDFSNIEVRLPHHYDISKAGKEISGNISELKIPVQITVDKKSGNEIIYNVYCKGFYTHRLKLTLETSRVSHRLSSPKIAIIIDDLGYDSSLANVFINLDLPLTLSVLPFTPHTQSIAREARKEGREIMLHLPMEPRSYPNINPGDGVLLVSMDEDMILKVLDSDLREIPFVVGVNNHMGSRFTENREKMMIVLAELKRRGLYFIDSKTSRNSVAFNLAKKIEIHTARRDIFLDNDLSESALKIQMDRLLNLARHRGHAIGIGHPHKETLRLLKRYQQTLTNEVEVVPVSSLLSH